MGVRIQTVTEDIATGMRLEDARGALVASVTSGSPAEQAGVEQGDIILSWNGTDIQEMRDLPLVVAQTPVDSTVPVEVWRRGEAGTLDVLVGELTDDVAQAVEIGPDPGTTDENQVLSDLGITLSTLDSDKRTELGLSDEDTGVLVTNVEPESAFAEKGVAAGDVIQEVDQEPVSSPDDVANFLSTAKDSGFGISTLLIYRGGDYRWVAVKVID